MSTHPNLLKRALQKLLCDTGVHSLDEWSEVLAYRGDSAKAIRGRMNQWLDGMLLPEAREMQKILEVLRATPKTEDIDLALDHFWWVMRQPPVEITPWCDDIWNTSSAIKPSKATWAAHFLMASDLEGIVGALELVDPSRLHEFSTLVRGLVNETRSDLQGPDNPERRMLLNASVTSFNPPMWVLPRIASGDIGTMKHLAMTTLDDLRSNPHMDDETIEWLTANIVALHGMNFGMTQAQLGLWVCGKYELKAIED